MTLSALVLLAVSLLPSARAQEADVLLTWTTTTCSDAELASEARARGAAVCMGQPPAATTVQYEPSRSAMGCTVWVRGWCGAGTRTAAYAPPSTVTVPTLYPDKDFKGPALQLPAGEIDLRKVPVRDNQPGEGGSWSRKGGSIKVPAGWVVRLCADPGGQGRCSEIDADVADLGTAHVGNDKALWVRITQGPTEALFACPRVYADDNFGGEFLEVCQDWPDLTGSAWNDRVSSVLVPAGWVLRLCQHEGLRAPCSDFDADLARIGSTAVGSDRTTSIQILAKP